jgi:hypothetical protein
MDYSDISAQVGLDKKGLGEEVCLNLLYTRAALDILTADT